MLICNWQPECENFIFALPTPCEINYLEICRSVKNNFKQKLLDKNCGFWYFFIKCIIKGKLWSRDILFNFRFQAFIKENL